MVVVARLTLPREYVIQWRIRRSGVVVADAVRFVSAGTGGGSGLYYVHSDHLGTPQKMTDVVGLLANYVAPRIDLRVCGSCVDRAPCSFWPSP